MAKKILGDNPDNCPCCKAYRDMDALELLIFEASTIEIDDQARYPFSDVEYLASLFYDSTDDSKEKRLTFYESQIKLLDRVFAEYYKEGKAIDNTEPLMSPGAYLGAILLHLYDYARKEKRKPKGFAKIKHYQNRKK